jgi:hypothetical protein
MVGKPRKKEIKVEGAKKINHRDKHQPSFSFIPHKGCVFLETIVLGAA